MINLKSILEILYFLSGPILALIAYKGLSQLKIAKDDIAIRTIRESALHAAEQINKFPNEIIPLLTEWDNYLISRSYDKHKNIENSSKLNEFVAEEITEKGLQNSLQSYQKLIEQKEKMDKIIKIMNILEGISIYFNKGIADEEIAFLPLSEVFCSFIRENYPMYCLMRERDKLNCYQNTIEIYNKWSARRKLHVLEETKYRLVQEIKTTKNNSGRGKILGRSS